MGLAMMLTHRVGVKIITCIIIIIPRVKMSLKYIYICISYAIYLGASLSDHFEDSLPFTS